MIEEILPGLYRVEVPLPHNPLKSLNSYVITAAGRSLIIDTGMNREECRSAMEVSLRELGVDLRETDFFITHVHADHSGLVSDLATDTSKMYFNQPDADTLSAVLSFGIPWEAERDFARMSGYPESELQKVLEEHPGYKYSPKGHLDFWILREGDELRVGDYLFKCVETPGHTRGHMCLYEPHRKILVAGDHILNDITPNVSLWTDQENPLARYLASLDKVYELDVDLVLPGHRSLFRNCKERIQELKSHHHHRAGEVYTILRENNQDAYQVASKMTWDLTYDSWELFPVTQKWFATGEAFAHLKYLEGKELVRREMVGARIVFGRTGGLRRLIALP